MFLNSLRHLGLKKRMVLQCQGMKPRQGRFVDYLFSVTKPESPFRMLHLSLYYLLRAESLLSAEHLNGYL